MTDKDFESLAEKLSKDTTFLNVGGANANETKDGLVVTTLVVYSVYLYLKHNDVLNVSNMQVYFREMNKYFYRADTFEYHIVNCARLKLEKGYRKPLSYCEVLRTCDMELKKSVFDALMAFVNSSETLEWVIREMENKDENI